MSNTDDSGPGSLRQPILVADAAAGADDITFNVPGGGVHTIRPPTPLPTLTGTTVVNGHSQPGASPNTLAVGNNAVLLIELDGGSLPGEPIGLDVIGAGSTVRGLVVNRFAGTRIGVGTPDHEPRRGGFVIQGNLLGTDPTGTTATGGGGGISVWQSDGNLVGTDGDGSGDAGERNVVSGLRGGMTLLGSDNAVAGNYIGTDAAGTKVLENNPPRWITASGSPSPPTATGSARTPTGWRTRPSGT